MPVLTSSNQVVERELHQYLNRMERHLGSNVLTITGEIRFGLDDLVRDVVESIKNKKSKLAVILETPGGYAEVVQRMVETLRKHYSLVDFLIPNYAMSAGTLFALSGDSISMDDYSRLGPIDPQVQGRNGQPVPALGYLERYEALIKKSATGQLTTAELNILVDGFDQAELHMYEQARQLSITLLTEWLANYKFKNWSHTETRGVAVTDDMKRAKAAEIAALLQDTTRWHVHGRGIAKSILEKDVGLRINELTQDRILYDLLRNYYRLLTDYGARVGSGGTVHAKGVFVSLPRS